jgi:hypothetical protein
MCFALTLITNAQTEDKKWNIGLHGGITQYKGDLGSDFYKFDQSWYGFGGIYEGAKLTIEGHADSQGADAYNLSLSQRRTESVKTYLMGKGIMESRLTAVGYGETKPIDDNSTAAGRAKNRRVELKTSY